ncbi:MAG: NADH-quinone oxidoreductase subunit NuoE [Clostridiaceae bacterium]|nr:NADH-quinone oxidoreductase subunit NuoE [Clostridiaceae bacterium]
MNGTPLVTKVKEIIDKYNGSQERLIQILLDLQKESGQNYLPEDCIEEVSSILDMPLGKVFEVATFYSMFNNEPKGRYVIEVCKSAPCHVTGSKNVAKMFEDALNIKMGETTSDNMFTLQYSSCFGGCDVSPAIKINEIIYGNLTMEKINEIIDMYRRK